MLIIMGRERSFLRMICLIIGCLLLSLNFTISANASLQDNEDGTVTQIRNDGSMLMWLKDANYSKTSGYDADGRMTWDQAQTWIGYLNSSIYLGYDDWRLPYTLPVDGSSYVIVGNNYDGSIDYGYNISSPNSELGYMFYAELDNKGRYDTSGQTQTGYGLSYKGPFTNLLSTYYLSDSTYNDTSVWVFNNNNGVQVLDSSVNARNAWAVRDAGIIPEPVSSILFVSGGAFFYFRRRR